MKQRVTRDPMIGNGRIFQKDPTTEIGSHKLSAYSVSLDLQIVWVQRVWWICLCAPWLAAGVFKQ